MNMNDKSIVNPITEVADWSRLPEKPLVSVVMITYNHEQYLAEAIEGVLAQITDFPVELIIGEDCSPDTTRAVALAWQRKHPEIIRVRFPERNLGVMPNFIATMEAARGEYIALCEGDDYWCDSGKLQKQVEMLRGNPEFAGVFHDAFQLQQVSGKKHQRIGERKVDAKPGVESIIRQMNIPTASMLFRRFDFTDRQKTLIQSTRKGDYMLSLLVAEQGCWKFIPEPMSVYRIHEGGVWSGDQAINIAKADIAFYRLLRGDAKFSRYAKLLGQKKANSLRQMALDYAVSGSFILSIISFIRSVGPRALLSGKYIRTSKYLKVLARELAVRSGFDGQLRKLWRRLGPRA